MRFGRTVEPGFLPVMSVPTEEDARALLVACCQTDYDGNFIAKELVREQTLENLETFGQRLAERWNEMHP